MHGAFRRASSRCWRVRAWFFELVVHPIQVGKGQDLTLDPAALLPGPVADHPSQDREDRPDGRSLDHERTAEPMLVDRQLPPQFAAADDGPLGSACPVLIGHWSVCGQRLPEPVRVVRVTAVRTPRLERRKCSIGTNASRLLERRRACSGDRNGRRRRGRGGHDFGMRARSVGALVLLAFFLRTRELGIGFWIDEGLSVGISDRPLGDIPDALRLDGSPPLYYLLLHVWMSVAGTSEEAVRALSVVFGLVAVPVAWWAARTLFGTRSGWMAAVLSATNPFLTQYAQEARMYALTVLLSLIASAAFARMVAFEDDRRRWAIGFAVAFAAMLYTHNWALFFGAACGAAWLFLLVRAPAPERRDLLVNGAIGFGGAVLLYLPWIPITLYQAAHTGAPWAESPTVVGLLAVPGRMLGQFAQIAVLLAAGAGLAGLFARRGGRLSPRGRARPPACSRSRS